MAIRERRCRSSAYAEPVSIRRPVTGSSSAPAAAGSDPGDLGAGVDDGVGVPAACVGDLSGEVFGGGDDVLDDMPGVVAVHGVEQLAALLPATAQHIDFRRREDAPLD